MNFNEYADFALDDAVQKFNATPECELLREALALTEVACTCLEYDPDLALWLESLCNLSGSRESFLYRQGFFDCVALLRGLQVLR